MPGVLDGTNVICTFRLNVWPMYFGTFFKFVSSILIRSVTSIASTQQQQFLLPGAQAIRPEGSVSTLGRSSAYPYVELDVQPGSSCAVLIRGSALAQRPRSGW